MLELTTGGYRVVPSSSAQVSEAKKRPLSSLATRPAAVGDVESASDLDELAIWQILSQIDVEAPRYGVDPGALAARLTYGVGTRLITSAGHSALNGVYKLVAIADDVAVRRPIWTR